MGVNQDTKSIVDAFRTDGKAKNNTYQAEVTKIDNEGVVWVSVAGSDIETPTAEIAAEVKRGDSVNVEWRNNKLYIAGNYSNPSAGLARTIVVENTANDAQSDATIAREAATSAVQSAATAGRAASIAQSAAEAAQATADIKKRVFTAQPVPPYNVGDLWVDLGTADFDLVTSAGDVLVDDQANVLIAAVLGTGSETVVYVSTFARTAEEAYTESDWTLAATDDAKVDELREWFWHDSLGAHVLGDATGFRNDITSTGMQIIDTSTETSVATFGASGISFYNSEGGNRHKTFSINSTGVVIYTETTEESTEITTDASPVTYVLSHKPTTAQGHNSFGFACPSGGNPIYFTNTGNPITYQWEYLGVSGGTIEYDGDVTCVITPPSRLGTDSVTALFYYEYEIVAPSYDVGTRDSTAGKYSAVIGEGLQAIGNNSVAVGKYNNDPYGGMLFSVGNGTADNARSNALTVDLSGNLTAAGEITDGGGNVLSNKADLSSVVTPVDYVTEQNTSGNWRYRKWHSGKIEAWFEGTFNCAASTTARGALYYSTWSLTIPSEIGFTATPNTLIGNTGDSTTVIAVNGAATSATAMSGKVWRYASSSSALSITARIYAWQN